MVLAVEPDAGRWHRKGASDGAPTLSSLLASFGVHTVVLALTLIFGDATPLTRTAAPAIVVELLPVAAAPSADDTAADATAPSHPPQAAARTAPAPDIAAPDTAETEVAEAAPAEPRTSGVLVRPATMLAAAALDEPGSRQARAALRTLGTEDRMEQLCDLEAMEQIEAWRPNAYRPELLVAYAFADTRFAGRTVTAKGAAFRSQGGWYRLSFACEVEAGMEAVAAFEFEVGEPIPRELWEGHYLEAGPVAAH